MFLVAEKVSSGPSRGNRTRVLAGEKGGDQEAGDLGFSGGSAVFVLGVDKALQHIVLRFSALFTGTYDGGEDFGEAFAGSVTAAVGGDGEVREYDTDGLHSVIEIVKKGGNVIEKLVANFFT